MKRDEVLHTAEKYIMGERNVSYGEPSESFKVVGALWTAYLDSVYKNKGQIDGADVNVLLALLKIARISFNPKGRDNYIDAVGYMAIAGELACSNEENANTNEGSQTN